MATEQILLFRIKVNREVMAMKGHSIFLKVTGLELHHQMVKCHIQDTRWRQGVLPLCKDAVCVFYNPSRLDSFYTIFLVFYILTLCWILFLILVNNQHIVEKKDHLSSSAPLFICSISFCASYLQNRYLTSINQNSIFCHLKWPRSSTSNSLC